jgi:hypothetical protein
MTQVLIDSVSNITFHNGVVRIECVAAGADGKPHPSGTLIIPGAVVGPVLEVLIKGTQELDKKIREQIPTAGSA